jgi:hypothetical protein
VYEGLDVKSDRPGGEGDAEDYETAQQSLQARVNGLSTDVKAEDFRDPEVGLAVRFGGWRKEYEEEYNNAYGGLAMVQGWEYWARQEMIGWEPSRVGGPRTFKLPSQQLTDDLLLEFEIIRLISLVRLPPPILAAQARDPSRSRR